MKSAAVFFGLAVIIVLTSIKRTTGLTCNVCKTSDVTCPNETKVCNLAAGETKCSKAIGLTTDGCMYNLVWLLLLYGKNSEFNRLYNSAKRIAKDCYNPAGDAVFAIGVGTYKQMWKPYGGLAAAAGIFCSCNDKDLCNGASKSTSCLASYFSYEEGAPF
ncbi:hypothetical protein BV898_12269 [Hypsibius exemplaris]|uniref:Lysozyme n=1 Tax=Hypsibius exemplaris TaxID=2072580 RepID=A0A1W0WEH0_HYPEX|nr:hypothetical protein BV898_12269 [Hypsibius exemplaris]